MPNYSFKCECGAEFERQFKMDEKHLALCECGKLAKKVYEPTGIIFKGDGWAGKS